MELGVRVESEDVRSGEVIHTSTAYLTMVALDDDGSPKEVPLLPRRRRPTRHGAHARPSSAATTVWQSGGGSRRSELLPLLLIRPLTPLGELALDDRVAHLHRAGAVAAGALLKREGGEHVPPLALVPQPDEVRAAGKARVERRGLGRRAQAVRCVPGRSARPVRSSTRPGSSPAARARAASRGLLAPRTIGCRSAPAPRSPALLRRTGSPYQAPGGSPRGGPGAHEKRTPGLPPPERARA